MVNELTAKEVEIMDLLDARVERWGTMDGAPVYEHMRASVAVTDEENAVIQRIADIQVAAEDEMYNREPTEAEKQETKAWDVTAERKEKAAKDYMKYLLSEEAKGNEVKVVRERLEYGSVHKGEMLITLKELFPSHPVLKED